MQHSLFKHHYKTVNRKNNTNIRWQRFCMELCCTLQVTFLVSVSFGLASFESSSSILNDFSTLTSLLGCKGTVHHHLTYWEVSTATVQVSQLFGQGTRTSHCREKWLEPECRSHHVLCDQEAAAKVLIVEPCFNKRCHCWWKNVCVNGRRWRVRERRLTRDWGNRKRKNGSGVYQHKLVWLQLHTGQ